LTSLIFSCNQDQEKLQKKRQELESQKRQLDSQKLVLQSSSAKREEDDLYPLIVHNDGKHQRRYDSLMKIQMLESKELMKIDSQLRTLDKQMDSLNN